MDSETIFEHYCEYQRCVGWTEQDKLRIHAIAARLGPAIPALADDLLADIERSPIAERIVKGGEHPQSNNSRRLWKRGLTSY